MKDLFMFAVTFVVVVNLITTAISCERDEKCRRVCDSYKVALDPKKQKCYCLESGEYKNEFRK